MTITTCTEKVFVLKDVDPSNNHGSSSDDRQLDPISSTLLKFKEFRNSEFHRKAFIYII